MVKAEWIDATVKFVDPEQRFAILGSDDGDVYANETAVKHIGLVPDMAGRSARVAVTPSRSGKAPFFAQTIRVINPRLDDLLDVADSDLVIAYENARDDLMAAMANMDQCFKAVRHALGQVNSSGR